MMVLYSDIMGLCIAAGEETGLVFSNTMMAGFYAGMVYSIPTFKQEMIDQFQENYPDHHIVGIEVDSNILTNFWKDNPEEFEYHHLEDFIVCANNRPI